MKSDNKKIEQKTANPKQAKAENENQEYAELVVVKPVGYPFDFNMMDEDIEIKNTRLFEEYARDHHIAFSTREELCANPEIIQMMKERIDTLQQQLAHYEQVKRFTLLPHHLSMEKGELTNTLKIRRRVLNENYKAEIDAMYAE